MRDPKKLNPHEELALCQNQVDELNYCELKRCLATCMCISAAAVVIQFLTIRALLFDETVFLAGIFLCVLAIFYTTAGDAHNNVRFAGYIWMTIILGPDAFFEAAFMPDQAGFLFMTLIMILCPLLIDAPWHMAVLSFQFPACTSLLQRCLAAVRCSWKI